MANTKCSSRRQAVLAYTLLLAYCGLIFYLSSQPLHLPDNLPRHSDKLVHFLEYGALGAFTWFALRCAPLAGKSGRLFLVAWVFASLYGLSDEYHQSFVPGRDASLYDALADSLGALAACTLFTLKNLTPR